MKKTITKSKHKTAPKDNHVQRVFNLIILDESGSMSSIAGQAISGLNEVFQTIGKAQKEHPGQQHFISFVTFNSAKIRTVFDRQAVRSDKEIKWTDYMPNSCTPLYDAMGESLNKLKKHVGDDDVVLVTIITDGYENASREYSGHGIKRLVAELKEKGWVFAYIGTNQDVDAVADDMGIGSRMRYQYSPEGAARMFAQERVSRRRFFDRLATHGKSIIRVSALTILSRKKSQGKSQKLLGTRLAILLLSAIARKWKARNGRRLARSKFLQKTTKRQKAPKSQRPFLGK